MWEFVSGILCAAFVNGCVPIQPAADGDVKFGTYDTKENCEVVVKEIMLYRFRTDPRTADAQLYIECEIKDDGKIT